MATNETSPVLSGIDFSTRCQSLLRTGLYTDLILRNIDPVTKEISEFNVHKCILAINSPVWESSIKWIKGNVLEITGFSKEVMHFLISFAYLGVYDFPSLEFCLDVVTAADFYNIPNLTNHCTDFIMKLFSMTEISTWNLAMVLNKASAYKVTEITKICFAYIVDHISEFLSSHEFGYLSKEAIMSLAISDVYFCEENKFIGAILEWTRKNIPEDQRSQFLKDNGIYKTFRFKFMKNNHISELLSIFPDMFSVEDRNTIFKLMFDRENAHNFDIFFKSAPRGLENIDSGSQIIVGSPPFEIIETFRYEGLTVSMPIVSIQLESGSNLSIPTFTNNYEEAISITLQGVVIDFNDIVDRSKGIIVRIPNPLNLDLSDLTTFEIKIVLKRPGIYKKNTDFSEMQNGLFRIRRGLIRELFVGQSD